MTKMQMEHLERISDLKDIIWIMCKEVNTTETECIKTLSDLIGEEIEKIQEEEGK